MSSLKKRPPCNDGKHRSLGRAQLRSLPGFHPAARGPDPRALVKPVALEAVATRIWIAARAVPACSSRG